MKKNISKEHIVETALELMRNKNDLRGLNLREVARTLGCAHTNLYNYFPSYSDLLWETHASLLEMFIETLNDRLQASGSPELKLNCFFRMFVNTYMDNRGWFRLAWHEHIGDERPRRDIEVTEKTNQELNMYISEIWKEISGKYPEAEHVKRVLHNTHCYIIGEISNYLSGRGIIQNEAEFREYVTYEAIDMFRLCLIGE